jgi:hypothetical protein
MASGIQGVVDRRKFASSSGQNNLVSRGLGKSKTNGIPTLDAQSSSSGSLSSDVSSSVSEHWSQDDLPDDVDCQHHCPVATHSPQKPHLSQGSDASPKNDVEAASITSVGSGTSNTAATPGHGSQEAADTVSIASNDSGSSVTAQHGHSTRRG